ncbi:MAG: oligopeptide ABC transporter, periplasmic oligopeptide-binding protein OppA [Ktedonobacterales bacterium]|jgi:ABC-type transport system substrate-binding protein/class 3 adenylate cyclase|nr:MAG: oligopeptide ABC transporter, periplasmic oligopeptide-binding protein OppA [Ktedonobacterales bacterium]
MAAPSLVTFADLLRRYRTAAGLTQEELAEEAGLSVDAISTLERGVRRAPRKDTVALLADALDLGPDDRAAFALAARPFPSPAMAATPDADVAHDGHAPAPSAALPHGAVTFLFADIEGSTRLLWRLGDDYADVLSTVQARLQAVWAAHDGHELGTQADHFFAVFARPSDALAAAAEAQRMLAVQTWPEGVPVRIRMGVHTGAALLTAGRYVGLEVQRAARIAAAGHGGQMLVSQASHDLAGRDGLPAGARLRDLGKHRLRGLGSRERLYQFVLPNLPATFPPLRTLGAWPGVRADLAAAAMLSVVLLAVAGLLLSLFVPAFPSTIGLAAGGLALVLLLGSALARPVRGLLATQWRDARKGVSAAVSVLLSLVIVVTTLFITKPTLFARPPNSGYDFTYTYHWPTRTGGSAVIAEAWGNSILSPPGLTGPNGLSYEGLWQGCIVQLPDVSLGVDSWLPDQCTEVPTVANGGQSVDYKTTIFHIAPQAVWSDGQPITADDFLFSFKLYTDPNIGGGGDPLDYMTLTKVDTRTVQIKWSVAYTWYLNVLGGLIPVPLHVYGTGKFAGVYDTATGAYNSALAQRMVAQARFNTTIPVDNGPFLVKSVYPPSPDVLPVNSVKILFMQLSRVVLVRNPRFFSNFFRHPAALDQVTFVTFGNSPLTNHQDTVGILRANENAIIASYRRGELTLTDGMEPSILKQLGGIPKNEVSISPLISLLEIGFNLRSVAPNARANGGASVFDDRNVRKAFVEAFDRCAAMRAELGIHDCTDPNLHTDEYTARPDPAYDPTVTLPKYNPTDAAALLDRAGFPVVGGIRRFKDGTTPFEITILLSYNGQANKGFALRMQQDYAKNLKIGVTVQPPKGQIFSNFDEGGLATIGAFDLLLYGDGGSPDTFAPLSFAGFTSANIPSAKNVDGGNDWGIVDPQIESQVQLANQTLNDAQRALVLRNLQRYFAQQFYLEPVYVEADVELVKPTLCNFKKWPGAGIGGTFNTWNMADWYEASSCP